MQRPLLHRTAVVSGASRGIGAAMAEVLASAGAHVIGAARTESDLLALGRRIDESGGWFSPCVCDLSSPGGAEAVRSVVEGCGSGLDVLVGNAGVLGPMLPVAQVSILQWDHVLALNLDANFRLIRALDPLLRAADAGRVLLMSSSVGHKAVFRPNQGPYAISKAALEALGRCYAAETSPVSAVKVMVVDPGPLRTAMRAAAVPDEDPRNLRTASELAARLLAFCLPSSEATGQLYHFPSDRVLSFQPPG